MQSSQAPLAWTHLRAVLFLAGIVCLLAGYQNGIETIWGIIDMFVGCLLVMDTAVDARWRKTRQIPRLFRGQPIDEGDSLSK